LGDKIAKNAMAGSCCAYGGRRDLYRVLVGKPEGKTQLGRSKRRWGIILRSIFRMWVVGLWTGSIWLRIETGGGHL
jgi:hypothetical protein